MKKSSDRNMGVREGFLPLLKGQQERHVCLTRSWSLFLLSDITSGMQHNLRRISYMEYQAGWILEAQDVRPHEEPHTHMHLGCKQAEDLRRPN